MTNTTTTITDGETTIVVHPLGAVHLLEFAGIVATLSETLGKGAAGGDAGATILAALPTIAGKQLPELFKLVDACCVPKLTEAGERGASIDLTLQAVVAWAKLSFPKDSPLPFVRAARQALDDLMPDESSGQPTTPSPTN